MNVTDKPKFSAIPHWQPWPETGARYLGTWYHCDCYLCDTTLLVRHGDDPADYASYSKLGYNEFDPTLRMGGLGEGRPACEVKLEGVPGYDNYIDRAALCAYAFLGREAIDRGDAGKILYNPGDPQA